MKSTQAQTLFPEKVTGQWEGMLHIYKHSLVVDSVKIVFEVKPTANKNEWVWRTNYLSPSKPMVKDYLLRLTDSIKQQYVTDEGGGLLLYAYYFDDKLYCIFETGGITLTSIYQLNNNNELIFEVMAGKKKATDSLGITNYSVDNLQKVYLRRIKPTDKLNIKGNFEDDYGSKYNISETLWQQYPSAKYHIIKHNEAEQYLIARNDDNNKSEPGLFTRIDYVILDNMLPYKWAFCLSVFDAKDLVTAENGYKANKENPRKGCNGFPFSRMKLVEPKKN